MRFETWLSFYVKTLAPRPIPKLEDDPLSAVRDCLFSIFSGTLHLWRPFLHLQPEEASCRGDRDPLIMDKLCFSETSVNFYQIERRHIPEDVSITTAVQISNLRLQADRPHILRY